VKGGRGLGIKESPNRLRPAAGSRAWFAGSAIFQRMFPRRRVDEFPARVLSNGVQGLKWWGMYG